MSETVGIWKKAVKLLLIMQKYWLEVLQGTILHPFLIFIELKAIYFRRCIHIARLLYASFLYFCISRISYMYWWALLLVNYHTYNFLFEGVTEICISKSPLIIQVQTLIYLFHESLGYCCQKKCCNKWNWWDLKEGS